MMEVIAEIGINHNGDLELAKKLIDIAYSAGCSYVKFQKRDIDLVYSREELAVPRESPWGTTTREQKEGLEFSFHQYKEIDRYCKNRIPWFVSVWDVRSVKLMAQLTMPFVKIPSALMTNFAILSEVKDIDVPVILSTGMSTPEEIKKAYDFMEGMCMSGSHLGEDRVYCIMACTSTYPTKPEEVNAKYIKTLKETYPCRIGFSNHYSGLQAMDYAACLEADMLEFHITLDRTLYGSDQAASIEPRGVFELMERLKLIEKMRGDGIKQVYDSEIPILKKLRR